MSSQSSASLQNQIFSNLPISIVEESATSDTCQQWQRSMSMAGDKLKTCFDLTVVGYLVLLRGNYSVNSVKYDLHWWMFAILKAFTLVGVFAWLITLYSIIYYDWGVLSGAAPLRIVSSITHYTDKTEHSALALLFWGVSDMYTEKNEN